MSDSSEHDDTTGPGTAPIGPEHAEVAMRREADVRMEGPLDLRALRIPPWVVRRTITIPVGDVLPADEPAWRDELVSVSEGSIEILGRCGLVVRLDAGAVLHLDGVPHVEVRCAGDVPAVLVALQRRRAPR